jgi:cell shape-determining protein MreC
MAFKITNIKQIIDLDIPKFLEIYNNALTENINISITIDRKMEEWRQKVGWDFVFSIGDTEYRYPFNSLQSDKFLGQKGYKELLEIIEQKDQKKRIAQLKNRIKELESENVNLKCRNGFLRG